MMQSSARRRGVQQSLQSDVEDSAVRQQQHSHQHRQQHGHSHRTGEATRYWRDTRGLTITLIVFILVVVFVNLDFSTKEPPKKRDNEWSPSLNFHPLHKFKNITHLFSESSEFSDRRFFMGPPLSQYAQRMNLKKKKNVVFPELAISIPFVGNQIEKIEHQWSTWKKFPPCKSTDKPNEEKSVLILNFDLNIEDFPLVEAKLRKLWIDILPSSVRDCFSSDSPKFFSNNLPSELNTHAYGSALQFYNFYFELYNKNEFTHWFQMEPDVIPIRDDWLTRLEKEVTGNKNCEIFWQRGSISFCREEEISPIGVHTNDIHLNGNSLYCIDTGMVDYLHRVLAFNNGHGLLNVKRHRMAWDQVQSDFRLEPAVQPYIASVIHKFQYADFIQNRCAAPYDTQQMAKDFPKAYLVHSKAFSYTPEQTALFKALEELDMGIPKPKESQILSEKLNGDSYLLSLFPDSTLADYASFTLLDKTKWILCSHWLSINGPGPQYYHTINEVTQKQCERTLCWNIPPAFKPTVVPVEQGIVKIGAKSFPMILKEFCKDVTKSNEFAQLVSKDSIYVWSSDLHASPIACSKTLLESIGATVHAEIDFGNCMYSNTCKKRLKVLHNDNWKAFSNDNTCPPKMARDFYHAYQNDLEMKRVDAVICSHPVANCELYMALNRSLIVYATTRLEFGRNDDSIDWRQPYMHPFSPARWVSWIDSLKRIAAYPYNSILANNQYDAHYIKYFTGIDAEYLPSWCDPPVTWQSPPAHSSILLGPYRDNLDFPRFDEVEAWKHPIMTSLLDAVKRAGNKHEFQRMRQLYPNYTPEQIVSHKALVWIPYQVSTMSWFEFYRMNIPIFAPSINLLIEWIRAHHILWERIYGHPKERIITVKQVSSLVDTPPYDPNFDDSDASLRYWLKFCDFYQHDTFPGVQLFDSWDHLMILVDTVDFASISLEMKEHNEREKDRIKYAWKRILRRAVLGPRKDKMEISVHDNVGRKPLPSISYDSALEEIYSIPTGPPLQEHALCIDYYSMRNTKEFTMYKYPLEEAKVIPFIPPTIGDCHPNIPPGLGICNEYCPAWTGTYRSDIRACVGDICTLLTEEACKDDWIIYKCGELCANFFPVHRGELIRSTTIITCITLFGLGGVLGLMFARSQYPLPDESDDEEDDEHTKETGGVESQHRDDA